MLNLAARETFCHAFMEASQLVSLLHAIAQIALLQMYGNAGQAVHWSQPNLWREVLYA